MNLRIIVSLITCLTIGLPTSLAQNKRANSNGIFRSCKSSTTFHKKDGLYYPKKPGAIIVSFSTNQFYGDISTTEAPADLFTASDMSYHGSIYYRTSFKNIFSYRAGLSLGNLSGARANGSNFESLFVEPSISLHYHPFYKNKWAKGFNLFLGIGGLANYMLEQPSNNPTNKLCIVPIIPIGMAYEIPVTKNLAIGFELSVKQALMDNGSQNIDNNYPFNGEAPLPDGYYSIGLTASYKL